MNRTRTITATALLGCCLGGLQACADDEQQEAAPAEVRTASAAPATTQPEPAPTPTPALPASTRPASVVESAAASPIATEFGAGIQTDFNYQGDGLVEVEHYPTVEEMAKAADAVVLGTPSAIRLGELVDIGDETVRYQEAVLTIDVREVLAGELTTEKSTAEVVFLLGETGEAPALAETLVANLPPSESVWYLRHRTDRGNAYRLVNSYGLVEMGPEGTAVPAFYRASALEVASDAQVSDADTHAAEAGGADIEQQFLENVATSSFDEVVRQARTA